MTTKTIQQQWQERAASNGKTDPAWMEVRKDKFPPDYQYTLNWSVAGFTPMVMDWTQDGLWNEQACYRELMKIFAQNAKPVLERIKRSDRGQWARITALLKRIETEEPSSELLGLYATYRPIVGSATDASKAAESVADQMDVDVQSKLVELGKRFYKVKHSGKAVLYDVLNDEWTWYEDCRAHYGHMKVPVLNPDTGKTATRNLFDVFKEWDRAPRYDKVAFNPRKKGHYDDTFNLWTGIAVEPEEGDDDLPLWELLLWICDDNQGYFDYVQRWLAHMIQKPWERPGTAIGISGEQGLGKNAFVETVGMLLSTPQMMNLMRNTSGEAIGKVLSTGAFGYFVSYDEVFGHFNALAGNKLLLLLDEATWGGFHNQKARFKTAITGPTIMINDKHMKQLEVPNYRRFILLSNDGHYLGVDANDRRLLPLEFKTENRPTDEWFTEFYRLRKEGKLVQHLLHRLQRIDIKDWEPMAALRKLEVTTGAALQQGSAPDYIHWLTDIADTGEILLPGDKEVREIRQPACGTFVEEDDLRLSYQYYCGHKDTKGWNKHDFVETRDKILGLKVQKRNPCGSGTQRGRNVPKRKEMQGKISALSKWKYKRFSEPIIEDDHASRRDDRVVDLYSKGSWYAKTADD